MLVAALGCAILDKVAQVLMGGGAQRQLQVLHPFWLPVVGRSSTPVFVLCTYRHLPKDTMSHPIPKEGPWPSTTGRADNLEQMWYHKITATVIWQAGNSSGDSPKAKRIAHP